MTLLMLTSSILLPTLVGFLFVTYFSKSDVRQTFFEKLFLGYGIGMGIITSEMFILGLLGLKLSLSFVAAIQIAIIILFCYMMFRSEVSFFTAIGLGRQEVIARKGRDEAISKACPERSERNEVLRYAQNDILGGFSGEKKTKLKLAFIFLLAGWILAKSLFVIYESSIWPIVDWDSLTTWSSSAKFFFYERGLALDPADENFFGRGYRDSFLSYPLHVPLMQVWFSLCLGEPHEIYMKIWNSFYFLSIIGLLFFSIKRESSLLIALLSAFFLSSVPLLIYHAISAYAELPLSYYSLAATICFWRYLNTIKEGYTSGSNDMLVLMGTFMVFGIWTKIEGLFFAIAFTIALSLFLFFKERLFKRFLLYLIPIVIMMGIWFIFLFIENIGLGYSKKMLTASFHFEVLPVIWNQIIFSGNFNIIFVLLSIMFFIGFRIILRSNLKYLFVALLSVMVMFLFVYIKTEYYKWVINLTAVNRNILTFIPMMYYISALTAIKVLKLEGSRRGKG